VVQVPAVPAGETTPVALDILQTVDLGGARFGVAAAPLPLGALLAGGQASAFQGIDAETLRDRGAVLTLPPAGIDPAILCQ
jgi:hypothetical protein